MEEQIQNEIEKLKLETVYYFAFKCCQFLKEQVSKDWISSDKDQLCKPKKYLKQDFVSWSTEVNLFRCISLLTNAQVKSPFCLEEWDKEKKINLTAVFDVFGSFLDALRYQLKEDAYKQLLYLMALILKYCNDNWYNYFYNLFFEKNLKKAFKKEYNDITKFQHKTFLNTQGSLFLIVPALIERFFQELPEILKDDNNKNLRSIKVFVNNFDYAKQIINIFLQYAYSQDYLNEYAQLKIEEQSQQQCK